MSLGLRLPRLVGTREVVGDLLADQDMPKDLTGQRFVVLCYGLTSASSSFSDELVKEILQERHAAELALVGASDRFLGLVRAAAARRGVEQQIVELSGAEVDA